MFSALAVLGKIQGAGPSSFGKQQRLGEIPIEPIKNLGAWVRFGGLCLSGPSLKPPLLLWVNSTMTAAPTYSAPVISPQISRQFCSPSFGQDSAGVSVVWLCVSRGSSHAQLTFINNCRRGQRTADSVVLSCEGSRDQYDLTFLGEYFAYVQ